MNIYGVFTFMSTLISWMIVSAVSWMVGDFTLQAVPADVAYYGSIVVVAAGIYAATMKAFRRGDMNQ